MKNDFKSLFKNSGVLLISSSSIKFISFLLMPLYTRALDTAAYGVTDTILNLALLVVGGFSLCIDWGMIAFFYDKKDYEYQVKITSSCTVFCIISAAACMLMSVFARPLAVLLFRSEENPEQYAYAVVLGFLYAALKLIYFAFRVCSRMRGDLKSVAIYSFVELIVLLIMNVLLILVFKCGYISILYANVISQVCCGGLYLIGNRKYVKLSTFDSKLLKRVLKYCIPLTPTVMLTWFNSFADRYFIGQFCGQGQVGLYGRAFQMVSILSVLTTSFLSAYPAFAYSNATDDDVRPQYSMIYDALSAILCAIALMMALFSKEIFMVMTAESYHEAHIAVGILCFGHVFYSLGNVMGYGITIQKNAKLYVIINFSGAICNVILNFILVRYWGYVGASITTCASQLLIMILSWYFAEKNFKCNYHCIKSIIVIFAAMAVGYLPEFFDPQTSPVKYALIVKLPVFIVAVAIILLVYRKRIPQIKMLLKIKDGKSSKTEQTGEI